MTGPNVICPRCRGTLSATRCAGCGTSWAGPLGIVNLDPEKDLDPLTRELLQRAERGTFEEVFEWYLPNLSAGRSETSARINVKYSMEAEQRSERMARMFSDALVGAATRPLGGVAALDLGCGMGAMLVALSRRFEGVVGIDLNYRLLALSALRLRDLGITNATLIHGTPGTLALGSESFDAVVALNVLEHLVDAIDGTLEEVRRILKPRGVFCADSRNRYDLFFLEPHVHLRLVGCLPRALQAPYVKWRTGRSYAGTRLLSPLEARNKLARHIGPVRVRMSQPSAFGKSTRADDLVTTVDRAPLLGSLARAVYPSLVLVAQRR
jgi:ubiquinone/menaquinone biosynthesis C-methylase UbiE